MKATAFLETVQINMYANFAVKNMIRIQLLLNRFVKKIMAMNIRIAKSTINTLE